MPEARRNVNPALAMTGLVDVTNYCIMFQQQFTYTLTVFLRQYPFEKKLARENAH